MKKFTIILISILAISYGVLFGSEHFGYFFETRLPFPGYKVLCSVDGSKYSLWMPGEKGSKGYLSPNVWNSEKAAIKWAYYWEKVKDSPRIWPSEKYEWEECQEKK